ncbi:hypothetical protein Verru16b_02799 [Lacunisphaera limnophila]|uniref:Vitamin K-dependent gamma-carboxylase n=1 Tax=Lacunisphaera limnophila TaxID=1838286 RepID=A0A1D8AXU2_9BACT|nr:lipase maturation factor family protein [Lacunisphaera limnophila]AOS45712.1 hypothetical protein Verru16b_02799 [Lacunisphaera limnophila]
MTLLRRAWLELGNFAARDGRATYLWPRWLVLRAIGIVYLLIFWGIHTEGRALIGPDGLAPVERFCAHLREVFPHPLERFIRAPSLFWVSSGPGMITLLTWTGLGAAAALVLNLWPRMALFACWACFLSFVSTWGLFSPTIIDQLMLETALLAIVFAPAGLRPGLGASRPPSALAVFMMRWLLFRIMFGSGLIKAFAGDTHWRDFTALDVMYETSPAPTILGFFDHQLPHAWHVGEIGLTFAAELLAPLLAVFGGARGRWVALGLWVALQGGIQLTGNFGWLNTAAIALGLLLLDDQMLAAAARRLRASRLAAWFEGAPAAKVAPSRRWMHHGLTALLWLHFGLGLHAFVVEATGRTVIGKPDPRERPVDYLFRDFRLANAYVPFASFPATKLEVEFAGSNDGGATWRPYLFHYKPQLEDRISPFLAPRFARFESSLQLALYEQSPVLPGVARQLLRRNPDVMGLFRDDPFEDRPATMIRIVVFEFKFTDLPTWRETGRFWTKGYVADFTQPLSLDADGNLTGPPPPAPPAG